MEKLCTGGCTYLDAMLHLDSLQHAGSSGVAPEYSLMVPMLPAQERFNYKLAANVTHAQAKRALN